VRTVRPSNGGGRNDEKKSRSARTYFCQQQEAGDDFRKCFIFSILSVFLRQEIEINEEMRQSIYRRVKADGKDEKGNILCSSSASIAIILLSHVPPKFSLKPKIKKH